MADDWRSVTFDLIVHSEKSGEQELSVTVDVSNGEWMALEEYYAKDIEIMHSRGLDRLYSRILDAMESEYKNLLDGKTFHIEKIKFPYEITEEFEERAKVSLVNAVFGYFSTLYYLNRKLIMLYCMDVIQNSGQYENELQQIILDLPRLIPYKYDKSRRVLEISDRDGLIEYSNELPFLRNEYEKLLSAHYDFIDKVRMIRNKLEHVQHGAKLTYSGSGGPCGFECSFSIKEHNLCRRIVLYGNEFICCVEELNTIFSKIQDTIREKSSEEELDKPYYQRILRYSFSNFNSLYHSTEIYSFGQALFPF